MIEKTAIPSIKHQIMVGIDDATKCPCIGSIFVSGVIANKKTLASWRKLGVKDSKQVDYKKRMKLADIIKKTAIGYAVKEITPAMIDDKRMNLNDWEMLISFALVSDLQHYVPLNYIHIDNWETSATGFHDRYKKLIEHTDETMFSQLTINREKVASVTFIPEHRSDEQHIVVGAASILSKTSSDQQYEEYKKIYGDFGSGNPGDPKTRLFIWQHRNNPLPIMRTSWQTYKTLINLTSIEEDTIYSRVANKKKSVIS